MKTSILVVTYGRDFRYLTYALRSIVTFARGFHEVVVSCPRVDHLGLEEILRSVRRRDCHIEFKTRYFDEWPGKGMLHHFFVILHADHCCPEADFVLHMDSDHVFNKMVSPETYIKEGKADLVMAEFDWLTACEPAKTHSRVEPGVRNWQTASWRALGFQDQFEFMRRAPQVHFKGVYLQTRLDIAQHTGEKLEDYIRDQRNKYPQTFAEFQSLGSVAFRKFNDRYNWYRQEEGKIPDGCIRQAWSHRPPTAEDLEAYKQLGLA